MITIYVFVLLSSLWIFWQDIVSRSVYWFTFPLLTGLFITLHILIKQPATTWLLMCLKNIAFLGFQFLLVWLYFSLKAKRFINVTNTMIGWGDILFLVSLAFYFSLLNFIVFYIGSLVLALLIALVGSFYSSDKKIPLAGLQALIFALFLTSARLFFHLDLMSDNYWLEYLMR